MHQRIIQDLPASSESRKHMSTTTTIAPGGKSKRELVAELYNEHARELWATFYKGCNDAELVYECYSIGFCEC